ncbi:unnamed protein product [Urochloa humidicola]
MTGGGHHDSSRRHERLPSSPPSGLISVLSDSELPLGHPLLRPELEVRCISRTEETLRYEIIIHFGSRSPSPSPRPSRSSSGDGGPAFYSPSGVEDGTAFVDRGVQASYPRCAGELVVPVSSSGDPEPAAVWTPLVPVPQASTPPKKAAGKDMGALDACVEIHFDQPSSAVREAEPVVLHRLAVTGLTHKGASEAVPNELVTFESQLPDRCKLAPAMDPMLFEFCVQAPTRTSPIDKSVRSPATSVTAVRTYRRRPRSVAAQPVAVGDPQPPATLTVQCVEAAPPAPKKSPGSGTAGELGRIETDTPSPIPCEGNNSVRPQRKLSRQIEPMTATKKARLQPAIELEEAKAATAAFLASVSQALQVPLASLPPRSVTTLASPSTALRRSRRLANQPANSTVRLSKKGEMLVMRKLGLLPADPSGVGFLHPELASVFRGPLDDSSFEAMRDMFPAARALSDADMRAVAMQLQASDTISAI